jgi:hypothetical protein
LDEDFKHRLDARKYVSLSRERRLGIVAPAHPSRVTDVPQGQDATSEDFSDTAEEQSTGYGDINDLFTESMPGALTIPQVLSTIDLDRIRINVGPHFCAAEVSPPLLIPLGPS